MPEAPRQPQPLDEPELPSRLAAELRRLFDAGVGVPAAVDEAILRDARAGFARRRRFWLAARWIGAGAAAAAAVVVLAMNFYRDVPPTNVVTANVEGDVDGSGRVDIVDALLLAKKVEGGVAPAAMGEDVNGDGSVDRRDVDAVAAIAVRLPGGVQ